MFDDISFSAIHSYYERVKTEIEDKAKAALDAASGDLSKLSEVVQTAVTEAKAAALQEVAAVAPDIQVAVEKALAQVEQAILAAIASRLG